MRRWGSSSWRLKNKRKSRIWMRLPATSCPIISNEIWSFLWKMTCSGSRQPVVPTITNNRTANKPKRRKKRSHWPIRWKKRKKTKSSCVYKASKSKTLSLASAITTSSLCRRNLRKNMMIAEGKSNCWRNSRTSRPRWWKKLVCLPQWQQQQSTLTRRKSISNRIAWHLHRNANWLWKTSVGLATAAASGRTNTLSLPVLPNSTKPNSLGPSS